MMLKGESATVLSQWSANNWIPWNGPKGIVSWAAESTAQQPIPIAGTVSRLYVQVTVAPGAGALWRIIFRVNSVDTILTCDVANLATTGSDLVNSVNVAAGDLVNWVVYSVPNGGATPALCRISCVFTRA